jgi:carboxypeptidase Q
MRALCPLLLALAACARTPHPVAPVAPAVAIPDSGALAIVRSLSDEVGPRLAGSRGDALAVAWAQRTMRAMGFANVRAEPVRVPHWERGEERGSLTAPVDRPLVLTALGGSVATPPEGLEAELIEVASLDALDALDAARVQGKIIFIHRVMRAAEDGAGYGETVGVRVRGAVHAARKGAVAVVIRSVGTGPQRIAHTGATRYDDAVPRIPAAALAIPDADAIHRLLAAGATVRMRLQLGCRSLPEADSANVVGEVPATRGDEGIVLLGAHLDAWDLGTGAIDDAAGASIILSAARAVQTRVAERRRTVRVVLFANEENGLAGARAYAQAHQDELARHTVAMEADEGDGRVITLGYAGDEAARPRFEALLRAVAPYGVRLDPEPARGGADVSPLIPQRVPRLSFGQDMTRYFEHHHTTSDTPDVVDARALDQAVAVYTAALTELVTMAGDFGRAPLPPAETRR